MRGYTVTRHTEMSHTKPEQNATNGIRTIVAKQKQQEVIYIDRMTFEIKIQNTWLCSVTIAQILQIIRRKSSAKRKFTGSTAHFIEKRVYSQRHTREGKTFILAKTRRESRRPVNPIITMRETPFSSSIALIKLSPEQDEL